MKNKNKIITCVNCKKFCQRDDMENVKAEVRKLKASAEIKTSCDFINSII